MKSGRIKLLIVALVLGFVMLITEIAIIKKASAESDTVKVLYTKIPIRQNTVIKEEMVYFREVSASYVHKQAVKEISVITGKMAAVDLVEGEMLITARLIEMNESNEDLAISDNPERRFFALELKPDQANAWQLESGQLVDIIFVPDRRLLTDTSKNFEGVTAGEVGKTISEATGDEAGKVVDGATGAVGKSVLESLAGEGGSREHINAYGIVRISAVRIAALIDDKGKVSGRDEKAGLPKYISFEVDIGTDEFLAWAKNNGSLEISSISYKK